jgi:hypothetical protein
MKFIKKLKKIEIRYDERLYSYRRVLIKRVKRKVEMSLESVH